MFSVSRFGLKDEVYSLLKSHAKYITNLSFNSQFKVTSHDFVAYTTQFETTTCVWNFDFLVLSSKLSCVTTMQS